MVFHFSGESGQEARSSNCSFPELLGKLGSKWNDGTDVEEACGACSAYVGHTDCGEAAVQVMQLAQGNYHVRQEAGTCEAGNVVH